MYKIPHPALKGAKVRLMLVPPRSGQVDPERQHSSSAESSLNRLERLPEQHWRDLQHVMEVRKIWAEQHGVDIEIKFVEDRPVFQTMIVGRECWFRPWSAAGSAWMQVTQNGRQGQFHDMVRDSFVNSWSHANNQLNSQLTAGPTGSQMIRKGVSVPPQATAPQRQPAAARAVPPQRAAARTMAPEQTTFLPGVPQVDPSHEVVTVTLS